MRGSAVSTLVRKNRQNSRKAKAELMIKFALKYNYKIEEVINMPKRRFEALLEFLNENPESFK